MLGQEVQGLLGLELLTCVLYRDDAQIDRKGIHTKILQAASLHQAGKCMGWLGGAPAQLHTGAER